MFRIVRFPSLLYSFFRSLTTEFHWEHYTYFCWLVLLIACAWGRRNMCPIAVAATRHPSDHPHRSRFNNFLNSDSLGGRKPC